MARHLFLRQCDSGGNLEHVHLHLYVNGTLSHRRDPVFDDVVRAVMSWLPIDDDNPILSFLYAVTEPVIMPVRYVVEYFGWFEGFPIDMSFLLTFILLSVIELFL